MKKKKITYCISDISKMIALEWMIDYLNPKLFELSFILINKPETEIEHFIKSRKLTYIRINYTSKKDLPLAIIKSVRFLRKNKTEIIHCHLFEANIIGLTASKLVPSIKKRIHTRHHSSYHHVYFPKAVKYDKYINMLSTHIVSISDNVTNYILKEGNIADKIRKINHGFLFEEYENVSVQRINQFKEKYKIQENDIVIGVIARYNLLKGIQFIIPAFRKFLKVNQNAKILIANGNGNDQEFLKKLLYKNIPQQKIIEVSYERDMGALYKSLDIYVHTPIDSHCEAYGQTYVEALISKTPSIFTLSGIASEFIVDKKNALVVPFENSDEIYNSLIEIMENKVMVDNMILEGYENVLEKFNLTDMIDKHEKMYLE